MKVTGSSTVEFENVMVGEVWLCSGQSNMEMGIASCKDAKEEVAAADYPNIRIMLVAKRWTPEPQSDIEGTWKVCSPKTVAEGGWGGFSAAAYYFGRELHKKLGVAVGLIDPGQVLVAIAYSSSYAPMKGARHTGQSAAAGSENNAKAAKNRSYSQALSLESCLFPLLADGS